MNELVPLVEESPIDNVPITFEPRLDEGFGTGLPEPEDVSRVIPHQELVIPDLRGDEHPRQRNSLPNPINLHIHFLRNYLKSLRIGVDVTLLDPVMTSPARVAGKAHTHRNARARAKRCTEFINRSWRREVSDFLHINSCVVVTLVFLGIGVPFEISEFQSSAVRHCPSFLLLIILPAEFREDLLCPCDDFRELDKFPPEENPNCGFTVEARMLQPVPDGGFSFPTSPRTAVENLENRAFQQCGLRPWLWGPEDCLRSLRQH